MPTDQFDERIATTYDEACAARFDAAALDLEVDFLADLAGAGSALELGIGTGRVALPLRRRGVDVHGIDLSPAMVDRLRAKPGGDAVPVTIGDVATTTVSGSFRLVYLVFNTITNLTTQAEQVTCFRNAAAHLEPGGCFVVEVGVPDLRRLPPGQTTRVFAADGDYVGFDEYLDLTTQTFRSHHRWTGDDPRAFSTLHRYVWPSELDLMARIAGLSLRERWSTWRRDPFTETSTAHVSVWERHLSA